MQTKIDIASFKDGHQTLVIETENPKEVETAVQTLEKKAKSGHLVYGKDKQTGEAINIQKGQFKEFVKSDQYKEKAVTNVLGGG